MRNTLTVLITLAAIGAAALSQESRPATAPGKATASASAPAGKKFDLRGAYKPGDSWQMEIEAKGESLPGVPDEQKMSMQMNMKLRIDVQQADKGGTVDMTVLRMSQKHRFGQNEMSVDTDKLPAEPKDRRDMEAASFKNARLKYAVDEKGKITCIEGVHNILAKLNEGVPSKDAKRLERPLDDNFLMIVTSPLDALPTGPVAIGDTWKVEDEKSMSGAGLAKRTLECTLKGVEDGDSDAVARIEIKGIVESLPNMEMGIPGHQKFKVQGESLFSINKGLIIQNELQVEPDQAQGNEMKINMKTTMKPADKSATKPAGIVPATEATK